MHEIHLHQGKGGVRKEGKKEKGKEGGNNTMDTECYPGHGVMDMESWRVLLVTSHYSSLYSL